MWRIQGGLRKSVVDCETPEEVLATLAGWHEALRKKTPWWAAVHAVDAPEPVLIISVGSDLGPAYWNQNPDHNARSRGGLPPRPPKEQLPPFVRPKGWVPTSEDDPIYVRMLEYLAKSRALDEDDDDEPVFRFAGEWEHPDPSEFIPYEQAFAAMTEFLATGRRPTNITWEDL